MGKTSNGSSTCIPCIGKKRSRTAWLFLAVAVLFVGSSCHLPLVLLTRNDREIRTADLKSNEIVPDVTYTLANDTYLLKKEAPAKTEILAPQGIHVPKGIGREWWVPDTVASYRSSAEDWPQIIAVLPAGTRLRCSDLRRRGNLVYGSWLSVHAVLLDGEHKGRLVDITDLTLPGRRNTDDKEISRERHDSLLRIYVTP